MKLWVTNMIDNKISKVILSNMCLIYQNDSILVINRTKKDWPGLSFPGGHVEENETIEESVIREMKEETNLDIKNIKLCAIKEWRFEDNIRYIGFLYKTNKFKGTLKSSNEGNVFFIKESEINNYKLSQDFIELYNLMKNN